jgi:hypothetical protein
MWWDICLLITMFLILFSLNIQQRFYRNVGTYLPNYTEDHDVNIHLFENLKSYSRFIVHSEALCYKPEGRGFDSR